MTVKMLHLSMIVLIALFPVGILAKPKELITWTTEVWPKAAEEDGAGAYFDLLTAVFPPSEFELAHTFLPYKRGVLYVKEGKIDLFSICTPMTGFYTSQHPWAHESFGVLYDPKIITNWNGVASLNNKNITLHKELEILPLVRNLNANLLKTDSKTKSLKLLEKRRADFFLDAYINIQHELKQNSNIDAAMYTFQPLQVITCYPGFSLSPKGKKLSSLWDERIEQLHNTGKLAEIFKKWQLEYPHYLF